MAAPLRLSALLLAALLLPGLADFDPAAPAKEDAGERSTEDGSKEGGPPGRAAAPEPSFEPPSNVFTEMKEVIIAFFRTIWEWLFGKKHMPLYMAEEDEVPEEVKDDRGPLLEEFCGMELGEAMAVDCGCCADHLVGDPLAAAALTYGGGPSEDAGAFFRNDSEHTGRSGRVRMWSIGEFVPNVWCDRDRPICRCEDPQKGWHVSEPACRRAGPCAPPTEPEELSSAPLNSTVPEAPEGTLLCAGGDRVPIGSARCEDMAVSQCQQLYALGPEGWHFCKPDNEAVRTCGAQLVEDLEAKRREEQELGGWVLQQAYSPELKWAVVERDDLTWRVDEERPPSAEEVRRVLRSWGGAPQP